MRHELQRTIRFIGANGFGTLLDLTLVYLLHNRAGTPLLLAVSVGWLANVSSGFILSRVYVFSDGTASTFEASWRYATLVALNLAVGVGAVTYVVSKGVPYIVARPASSTFLVAFNLVASRWVFGIRRAQAQAHE